MNWTDFVGVYVFGRDGLLDVPPEMKVDEKQHNCVFTFASEL